MKRFIHHRFIMAAITFVIASGFYLAAPPAPRAASAECGPNSGKLCKTNHACVTILFFNQCTTDHYYYEAG